MHISLGSALTQQTLVNSRRHLVRQSHIRMRYADGSKKRGALFLFSDTCVSICCSAVIFACPAIFFNSIVFLFLQDGKGSHLLFEMNMNAHCIRLLVALRSKTTLTGTLIKRISKPYRQLAVARLASIDAHDIMVDRCQPQMTFCVRFAESDEGVGQVLYLEVGCVSIRLFLTF
jgi:hypothetical protein